jgi:nucleotide-binding universal stress UspA family protein
MYKTILAPYDGSETGARALPIASDLARSCGARLYLLMVHDPSMFIPFVPGEVAVPVYDSAAVTEQRQQDEREIQRIVESLQAEGVDAAGTVLEGTVVETIAEHAQAIGADITVMSTHGRGGFNRVRLGSVANSYITRTSTPTLLVRIHEDTQASTTIQKSGRLLCPLDGSEFAESMLPHAIQFAESYGLQMELFSVTTPTAIPMAPFGTEALIADPRDITTMEDNRDHYLERIAATCPPGTTTRVLTDMDVSNAIVEVAREEQPAAIALATHGRSGLMRMMLGSVADDVIRRAPVPILVYKPDKK